MSIYHEIAERSLMDCHAIGVDSLVLSEAPMVRMFVTRENHTLWRNAHSHPMSVGFHNHRTDLRLTSLSGTVYNITATPDDSGVPLRGFTWESAIRGGSGEFRDAGHSMGFAFASANLLWPVSQRAHVLHTVYVPRGEIAAWIVEEADEDPYYEAFCYSNADLAAFDSGSLYRSMSADVAKEHMRHVPGWLRSKFFCSTP